MAIQDVPFKRTVSARLPAHVEKPFFHRPQSSYASPLTAGASGFVNFSQSGDRPERASPSFVPLSWRILRVAETAVGLTALLGAEFFHLGECLAIARKGAMAFRTWRIWPEGIVQNRAVATVHEAPPFVFINPKVGHRCRTVNEVAGN
jgi:hypothetical protein